MRREACPPDLRAARGLPARSPSTPRASLAASPRSPARPCRPRTTLRSGDHDHWHRNLHPNELHSKYPARPPCGARPARPLAVHAASFARRVASKPGQALQASRHPPIGPPPTGTAATSPADHAPPSDQATMTTGTAATTPHTSLPFFLWLPRRLLQHSTTAGNTADEIGEHSGSQRDKTLPAQLISRSNGTKFSLRVIKRSFWPVLRMQGEFYPGYDIRGPQQGEFCPGILVALGLQPGSAMIIHVFLARQRP